MQINENTRAQLWKEDRARMQGFESRFDAALRRGWECALAGGKPADNPYGTRHGGWQRAWAEGFAHGKERTT